MCWPFTCLYKAPIFVRPINSYDLHRKQISKAVEQIGKFEVTVDQYAPCSAPARPPHHFPPPGFSAAKDGARSSVRY